MQMNAYSLCISFGQPLYRVHTTDDVNWRATFHATAKTRQTLLGISVTLSPADHYQILPSTRPWWRWCLSRAISSLYPRAMLCARTAWRPMSARDGLLREQWICMTCAISPLPLAAAPMRAFSRQHSPASQSHSIWANRRSALQSPRYSDILR